MKRYESITGFVQFQISSSVSAKRKRTMPKLRCGGASRSGGIRPLVAAQMPTDNTLQQSVTTIPLTSGVGSQ